MLSIEEARRIRAVVGPADLRNHLLHLRKRSKQHTCLIHESRALGGPGAWCKSAAHPDCAFIQMREKFGTDHTAIENRNRKERNRGPDRQRDRLMLDGPAKRAAVTLAEKFHDRVVPRFYALAEKHFG